MVDKAKILEPILVASLARTVDLLKFAETKNAALVTLCSAWVLAGIATYLNDKNIVLSGLLLGITWCTPIIVVAGGISLWSFFPDMNFKKRFKREANPKKNILFYEHAKDIPIESALAKFAAAYVDQNRDSVSDLYLQNLSEQIVINSGIASRKFRLFQISLSIFALGLILYGSIIILAVL